MKKDRTVLLVVFVFIFVLLLQYSIIFIALKSKTSARDISANVLLSDPVIGVSVCFNHPPSVNVSMCNDSVVVDYNYTCYVNATDIDGNSITFDTIYYNETYPFEIELSGLINFTPNINDTGNYTIPVRARDSMGCSNSDDMKEFEFEVYNINDPPYLATSIPNQSWNQDTTLDGAFDLDDYFFDPDLDVLSYTRVSSPLDNIRVTIDSSTNEVTFAPLSGWYGTEYVMFMAWDPFYANASSNNLTLIVNYLEDEEQTPDIGGGGGGGGGGSASVPDCIPRWYCRPWGKCQPDNLVYRDCYDLNNCSNSFGKPNVTESCEFESTCYDGIKGPDEEGVDCGGPCPNCGTCYDKLCNNNEDCTKELIELPDCGGSCKPCEYIIETCFDGICNNNEDCTKGLTQIPDCGGTCNEECPVQEQPVELQKINWSSLMWFLILLVVGYTAKKSYPYLLVLLKKRRKKMYEERLLLETKVTESILESLKKIEEMIANGESIQKIIVLFSALVRKYFKNLFELGYEFTYQEIMNELRSRNISPTFKSVLKNFFERSLEVEFSGVATSRAEMSAMVSEFKEVLSLTSKEPLKTDERINIGKGKMTKVDIMFLDVAKAESHLRRNELNLAYGLYVNLHKKFNELSDRDKKRLHGFISRLYEEVKLARENYETDIS